MREMKIQIPENDYQILIKSLRSTLRIRPSQTEKFLQQYLQEKYDEIVANGEDSGDITLQLPTPDMLIKWIKEKK